MKVLTVGRCRKVKFQNNKGSRAIVFYKVGDQHYPSTENNRNCLDAYIRTGDEAHLNGLKRGGIV
jgi:hypothetical protein